MKERTHNTSHKERGELPRAHPRDYQLHTEDLQHGRLVQNVPNHSYIKRFEHFFEKLDRAVTLIFQDMEIVDRSNVRFRVPVMFGTVERIAYSIFGESSSNDPEQYQRVRLPLAAIVPVGDVNMDMDRHVYHKAVFWDFKGTERRADDVVFGMSKGIPISKTYNLILFSRYLEDMNMMMELAYQPFSPEVELRLGQSPFSTFIRLESCDTNTGEDPDPNSLKLYRATFTMQAFSYIPQPIKREKAVLRTRIDFGVGDPTKLGGFQSDVEIDSARHTS